MPKQYVLYDEQLGVYLGSFIGLGFWSKLDCGGQDSACCFETPEQIREYILTWDEHDERTRILAEHKAVEVIAPTDATWVPMGTCVAAGLPAWNYRSWRDDNDAHQDAHQDAADKLFGKAATN